LDCVPLRTPLDSGLDEKDITRNNKLEYVQSLLVTGEDMRNMIVFFLVIATSVAFPDQKDTLALELVDLTSVLEVSLSSSMKNFDASLEKFKHRFTPSQYSEYKSLVAGMMEKLKNDPYIKNEFAQIYKSHFTEEELQELVALFQAPAWQKYKANHLTMSDEMDSAVKEIFKAKFTNELASFLTPILQAAREK
jgi:hemerythrin